MVPAYTTVQLQLSAFVVQVQTRHLGSGQSLTTTTETATATTTGESHVVGVVGISHQEHIHAVLHQTTEDTSRIAFFRTCSNIGIGHHTFVHTSLDAEVEHRLLLTVVNTADTGQIALLVVGLDAVDDIRRQVLHGSLRVARHELLTVDEDFLHLLTIDLDGTVVAHLCTWQTTHQLLDHRTFGGTEGSSIINKGISLQGNLSSLTGNRRALQHDGIGLHSDSSQGHILVSDIDALRVGLETHTGYLEDIITCLRGLYRELAFHVGQHALNEGAVRLQQFNCCLGDGVF